MTNKEKFLTLVSKEKTNTLEKNKERIRNRAMLRESQQIAIKVLKKLDELNWTQKDLAKAMEVSPQQINKIVRGQENLTLGTLRKLQDLLDIPVLASYYETKINTLQELILTIEKRVQKFDAYTSQVTGNYISTKVIKMECNKFSSESSYKVAI